jgi:uncharacterized protein
VASQVLDAGESVLALDKLRSLVLQPTPFCNLDCGYCYLGGRQSRLVMTQDVIAAAIKLIGESGLFDEPFQVLWHAGEPLVVGRDFYARSFDLLAKILPTQCTHRIVTNATLVNRPFAELLKSNSIEVVVSIDGPQAIHDARRTYRSGSGSFEKTMRGLECLRSAGIEPQYLCVVGSHNIFCSEQLFEFFSSIGARVIAFNVEEREGANVKTSIDAITGIYAAFYEFLSKYVELNCKAGNLQMIREIDQQASRLIASVDQNFSAGVTRPFAFVNVAADGSFSTYSPELLTSSHPLWGDFTLGNVLVDRIDYVTQSDKFLRLSKQIGLGVDLCREKCEYFPVCGGGAPANKIWELGRFDATETIYCQLSIQVPTRVVLNRIASLLAPPPNVGK